MSNDRKIGMFFLVFILFFVGSFYYASKNGLRGPVEKEEETLEVKTYAIQSHEYYDDLTNFKYVITSKDELEIFKSKFTANLKLDDVDFNKNKVFIQLEVEGSGSVEKEVTDFIIDTTVLFVIKTKTPGIGTDDMALWYYIAIVPNSKLEDVNYSAWQNPSDVLEVLEDYIITTDSKYLTMQNDGGSNTDIYYNIDSKNKKISKIIEVYEANLGGTPVTNKTVQYEKNINIDDIKTIKELYDKDLDKDTELPYKINNKDIYNSDTINSLKEILEKYDNA